MANFMVIDDIDVTVNLDFVAYVRPKTFASKGAVIILQDGTTIECTEAATKLGKRIIAKTL